MHGSGFAGIEADRNHGAELGCDGDGFRLLRPPLPLPIGIVLDRHGGARVAHPTTYPLIAPAMIPSMKRRWKRRKMITIGRVPMKEPAITAPYSWL